MGILLRSLTIRARRNKHAVFVLNDVEEVMKAADYMTTSELVHDPKQHRRTSDAERRVEREMSRLCEDGSNDGNSKATEGDDVASSGGSGLLSWAALGRRGSWAASASASNSSGTSAGNDARGGVDTRNDGSGGGNWSRGNCSGTGGKSRRDSWDLRGSRNNWSGWSNGNRSSGSSRRSLDLAVADLRDGLDGRGDFGLRSGGNEASEEGNGDGREAHLDGG